VTADGAAWDGGQWQRPALTVTDLASLHVLNHRGGYSVPEWEIARLYQVPVGLCGVCVFVFVCW